MTIIKQFCNNKQFDLMKFNVNTRNKIGYILKLITKKILKHTNSYYKVKA